MNWLRNTEQPRNIAENGHENDMEKKKQEFTSLRVWVFNASLSIGLVRNGLVLPWNCDGTELRHLSVHYGCY